MSPLLCMCDVRGRRSIWCSPRDRVYGVGLLCRCLWAGGKRSPEEGARPGASVPWQAPVSPLLCMCDVRGRRSIWCSPRDRVYGVGLLCRCLWAGGKRSPEEGARPGARRRHRSPGHPTPWRAPNAAPATEITPAQRQRHRSPGRTSDPLESTKCCACQGNHIGTAAATQEQHFVLYALGLLRRRLCAAVMANQPSTNHRQPPSVRSCVW